MTAAIPLDTFLAHLDRPGASPAPTAAGPGDPPAVKTVSDLTDEHIGWEILVPDEGVYPLRTLVVSAIRKWTYEGRQQVGILDTSDARPGIRGTEHHRDGDAPCKLLRQVPAPRRRRGGRR